MNKLKSINKKVQRKQIGRMIGGISFISIGMIWIAQFIYQNGINDTQKSISEEFPEEYRTMIKKIIKILDEES